MENYIELKNVTIEIPMFDVSRSFRQSLANRLGGEIKKTQKQKVYINALSDISLTLKKGDRVGLIGHNGAGKTTFLRLLANIYRPSWGEYICHGKVTSLFNISLGIDLDDTGLENLYTIGMFLGMKKKEIKEKQDEIIAFSELGDYIHLPMRSYSAGMLTRLSFALTTALEPDILLMDEGIGAGDARFSDKAEERLNNFYDGINTIVLASHSFELIRKLCNKALLLEHGRVKAFGDVEEVIELYVQ